MKYSYSILTACLNSSATMQRSIDSVLRQNPLPSQYVFVDGGSSDKTLDIIRNSGIAERGIELEIISQTEKTGITGAWNLGLAKIRSDLVFILNSDDWYEASAAEKVLDGFDADPTAEIVLSPAWFHLGAKKNMRTPRPFFMLPFLMPVVHPGCFVKKSVYERLGGFDGKYRISADYEFIYRCTKAGIKFREIRSPVVNMTLGGAANSSRAVARLETMEIAEKYSSMKFMPRISCIIRKMLGR